MGSRIGNINRGGCRSMKIRNLEASHTGASLDEKIEKMVEEKVSEAMEERVEKEQRKLNLIVVNLPESREKEADAKKNDEILKVKELFRKMCPELEKEEVKDPVRLGREGGNKPRMLRVRVESEEGKQKILKNMRKLNVGVEAGKRVFINPDFTPKEREKNKELRAELKQRIDGGEKDIGIRGGKIVQVKWHPRSDLEGQKQQ